MRGLSGGGAATVGAPPQRVSGRAAATAAAASGPLHRLARARALRHAVAPDGTPASFDAYGSGRPLVLVHGAFSDHDSNWEHVRERLARRFTVHAIARRGRGATPAKTGHALEDEAHDVAAVVATIAEPVFLLGHSYGAQVALSAAVLLPGRVRKLVLYEPPLPALLDASAIARFEALAAAHDWDAFACMLFRDVLRVPATELDEVRRSPLWSPIVADAPATLHDLRALVRHRFEPERFATLHVPALLQIGSESPRELYATDALAAVLPDVRVEALAGQAHEAMTAAPDLYAASVERFLLA